MFFSIIVTLVIVGVLLWGVQQLPMNDSIKKIVVVLVVVFAVLWALSLFTGHGFYGPRANGPFWR